MDPYQSLRIFVMSKGRFDVSQFDTNIRCLLLADSVAKVILRP